jgi:hypothetical protein
MVASRFFFPFFKERMYMGYGEAIKILIAMIGLYLTWTGLQSTLHKPTDVTTTTTILGDTRNQITEPPPSAVDRGTNVLNNILEWLSRNSQFNSPNWLIGIVAVIFVFALVRR